MAGRPQTTMHQGTAALLARASQSGNSCLDCNEAGLGQACSTYLEALWGSLTRLLGRVAPSARQMDTSVVNQDVQRLVLGQELINKLANGAELSYI